MTAFNTPIVLLVFNRAELTRQVLRAIRVVRPMKLLVVCDGPRIDCAGDLESVAETRAIIAEEVDWPCNVVTNYAVTNLGCRNRILSGLDWAFSLVTEAIILEDDCLPDCTFFSFCETLLEHFRDDSRVMHIGGNNFHGGKRWTRYSYYFSKYNHIWGWATWRRAWRLHVDEHSLSLAIGYLEETVDIFDSQVERAYWLGQFRQLEQTATTWDFYWTLTCWLNQGHSIYPELNLVENCGFERGSTHTREDVEAALRIRAERIGSLRHPPKVKRNRKADRSNFYRVFLKCSPTEWRRQRLRTAMRSLLRPLVRQ